jgi:hypothetical protein
MTISSFEDNIKVTTVSRFDSGLKACAQVVKPKSMTVSRFECVEA